jgi:hypothetical protein
VHDPVTAEILIPKCHGFGTKRVPMETRYFEAYNPKLLIHFANPRCVYSSSQNACLSSGLRSNVLRLSDLTVFQRTPNWSLPLRNAPLTPEEMDEIRTRYPESTSQTRVAYTVPPRMLACLPGSGRTCFACPVHAFIANKIRERVHDPVTAEILIPKCHGFGTKRVPMELRKPALRIQFLPECLPVFRAQVERASLVRYMHKANPRARA